MGDSIGLVKMAAVIISGPRSYSPVLPVACPGFMSVGVLIASPVAISLAPSACPVAHAHVDLAEQMECGDTRRACGRWLHVQRIQRIEFFSPGDATTLWGIDHPNGAIQIVEYR